MTPTDIRDTAIPEDIPLEIAMHAERLYDEGGYLSVPTIIARAIMAATEAERERCAKIAEGVSTDLRNRDGARFTASKIAAAIRAGTKGASND